MRLGLRFWIAWLLLVGGIAVASLALEGWLPGQAAPGAVERARDQTTGMLHGTWLREYSEQGAQVWRQLSLQADGTFSETVHVQDAHGRTSRFAHEGTWLYDGTNLKRKYTLMNGKPPSRLRMPFATFEITFPTRDEFRGVDHIHGNRVLYRRTS